VTERRVPETGSQAGRSLAEPQLLGTAPEQLRRSVFKSSSFQMAGRAFLALSRLVIAALIVRAYGPERYGEYALVLVLTAVPEWIVDFGLNDIFSREICREPQDRQRLLRTLTASKLIQVAAAYLGLVGLLLVMRYPPHVTRAALIAGAGLVFYGGILVYRSLFKATLTLERDILAESVSLVVLIPLLWAACLSQASLEVLALCYVVSRAVFLALAVAMGRHSFRLAWSGIDWTQLRWGFRESAAIGMAGFLVGVYEVVDMLVLSKLASAEQLGFYSAAQKLVWPTLTGFAVVGMTIFPVLSSAFGRHPERFRAYFQGGVDAVILLAAVSLSGLAGGADFLTGLLGPSMGPAAPVLRVLALLCFVKAISSTVGPVLYVTGAQRHALWITGVAALAKSAALLALVPRYGAMGAAVASLVVEIVAGLIPNLLVVQHFARCRLRWTLLGKVVVALAVSHGAIWLLGIAGSLPGSFVAAGLFTLLAVASGALRPRELLARVTRPAIETAPAG
jgi:O-antigen/teichoic acid export membrane protein